LIATVAAIAMALSFQIPLRGWLSPLVAAPAISLIAGVLVGAFFGLYTAKRIVERRAHRRVGCPRPRLASASRLGSPIAVPVRIVGEGDELRRRDRTALDRDPRD
jgi:hypothetical protein